MNVVLRQLQFGSYGDHFLFMTSSSFLGWAPPQPPSAESDCFSVLPFAAENLLASLLRIKEVIRRRVESSEEDDPDERGMTQRLEDILKESSGEDPPP